MIKKSSNRLIQVIFGLRASTFCLTHIKNRTRYCLPLALAITVISAPSSNAQPYNGTEHTNDHRIVKNRSLKTSGEAQILKRTFNLTIHLVKNRAGETNITPAEIAQAISDASAAFAKIEVSFRQAHSNEIDNYHFNSLKVGDNEPDLTTQFYGNNTINLYLVDELKSASDQELCSYLYTASTQKDVMIFEKNCFSGNVLIKQLGFFFNLYETHETRFGEELVDGSNCTTTGDLCCDTPADPNLENNVDNNCNYKGSEKDQNGDYYKPSPANYMSASSESCGCYFSEEQFMRMLNTMVLYKSHLW